MYNNLVDSAMAAAAQSDQKDTDTELKFFTTEFSQRLHHPVELDTQLICEAWVDKDNSNDRTKSTVAIVKDADGKVISTAFGKFAGKKFNVKPQNTLFSYPFLGHLNSFLKTISGKVKEIFSKQLPESIDHPDSLNHPFTKNNGLRVTYIADGKSIGKVKVKSEHLTRGNMAHGGFTFSICDSLMQIAAESLVKDGKTPVAVNVSQRFSKPIQSGEELTINASVTEQKSGQFKAVAIVKDSNDEVVSSSFGQFLAK